MRQLKLIGFSILLLVETLAATVAAAGPVAVVDKALYKFTEVFEGTEVRHDFVIRNTGDAPLLIKDFKSFCDCTTFSFPESIPAGGEGIVTIKVNTAKFGGETIAKNAKAYTNDPRNREIEFTITGRVELFAEITPARVIFNGPVGTALKQQVRVFPGSKNPFKIISSESLKRQNIRFQVKETTDDSGRSGYIIDIENIKTDAGTYQDKIVLETDSKIKPELTLRVLGNIRDLSQKEEDNPDRPGDKNIPN